MNLFNSDNIKIAKISIQKINSQFSSQPGKLFRIAEIKTLRKWSATELNNLNKLKQNQTCHY